MSILAFDSGELQIKGTQFLEESAHEGREHLLCCLPL